MLITEKKLTPVDNFIGFRQQLYGFFTIFTTRIFNEMKHHESLPGFAKTCA